MTDPQTDERKHLQQIIKRLTEYRDNANNQWLKCKEESREAAYWFGERSAYHRAILVMDEEVGKEGEK